MHQDDNDQHSTILFPVQSLMKAMRKKVAAQHNTAPPSTENVLLLAADFGLFDAERSLDELSSLCEANGMRPVAEVLQKRDKPNPATVLGEGKLAEAAAAQNLDAMVLCMMAS